MTTALLIFIIIGITMIITGVLYMISKGKTFKSFYHNSLGWHIPNDELGFDGCSLRSTCKLCGKEIMQDSQGNCFNWKEI